MVEKAIKRIHLRLLTLVILMTWVKIGDGEGKGKTGLKVKEIYDNSGVCNMMPYYIEHVYI